MGKEFLVVARCEIDGGRMLVLVSSIRWMIVVEHWIDFAPFYNEQQL